LTIRTHTLSNGFRIVTEAMPNLKSASIGVWVLAGGRHERIEQNGIAHFLEHMAFKGTANRTALQIAEQIEDVGGYINAYTSREMTAYYARVLEEDVTLGLDIIGDILMNPVFNPHDVDVERGVILQEIGLSYDTPDDIVFDWLQEAAYPDQPLGRTILGPTERVSAFQNYDLQGFMDEHYAPDRMILSAAGAVDHDAIVKQAEAIFGGMKSRPNLQTVVPATFRSGEKRELKALEQVHFTLGFEGPDYLGRDIFTAQIYSSALGGGISSRLFQEIRENRGLCYSIFAQTGAYADTGMMTIYAGTSSDDIAQLTQITMDEMKRAADDMSEAEVARARAQMKAGLLMGLETPSNRAERLVHMLYSKGRIIDLEETVAMIDNVSVQEVREFAGKMAGEAEMAMAIYGPGRNAPDLDTLRSRLVA
jgi:predicted Zn-dependent peptidase